MELPFKWKLEQADAWPPIVLIWCLGIDNDLVREGVRISGGDGRDMVLVTVYDGDDLVCRLFKRFSHGPAYFQDI